MSVSYIHFHFENGRHNDTHPVVFHKLWSLFYFSTPLVSSRDSSDDIVSVWVLLQYQKVAFNSWMEWSLSSYSALLQHWRTHFLSGSRNARRHVYNLVFVFLFFCFFFHLVHCNSALFRACADNFIINTMLCCFFSNVMYSCVRFRRSLFSKAPFWGALCAPNPEGRIP